MDRDWRLHVELAIHGSPTNVQWVLAVVDARAESMLLYGNPEKFSGPEASIDGYRWHSIKVKYKGIIFICSPDEYTVYVSLIPEYILGIYVLQGLWLQTTVGEFCLRMQAVKDILQGHSEHPPFTMMGTATGAIPTTVMAVKQYWLPEGHKDVSATIEEIEASPFCEEQVPVPSDAMVY